MGPMKESGLDTLGQLLWILMLVAVITVAFSIPLRNKRRRERVAAQAKQDRATLADFADDFGSNGRSVYMSLPSRAARLEWLTYSYPEFMETISRHEPDREIDSVVAFYLDIKLLAGVSTFPNRDNAIRAYRITGANMSLNAYQDILDKRVEDQRKAVVARVMEQRKLEEARREEQKETQRQQSREKKNAKRYWKSLSKEQQAAFMKARGVAARKKVLRASSPSDDFELGRLYYLIMATQFSDINMNYSSAIDSCVSSASSYTHSPQSTSRYDDGGSTHTDSYSHHTNDSSSSYSGYSSSSDTNSSSSDSSYSSSSDSGSSCSFD